MLTLIHGDNIGLSRNYYLEIKSKFQNIKIINGDKVSMTEVVEGVEGNGLFSTIDAVFIEQLFSKKKAGTELDAIMQYILFDRTTPIILWEGKEIDKKQVMKLHKAIVKIFSYPKTLFQLLDALQPHNGKQLNTLFHQTLQTEAAELILFMLTKHVRLLMAMSQKSQETIDEVKRMQSWQVGKVQKQAKMFRTEQLVNLHSKLYDFDLGYKTGGLATSLESSLDFFFVEI